MARFARQLAKLLTSLTPQSCETLSNLCSLRAASSRSGASDIPIRQTLPGCWPSAAARPSRSSWRPAPRSVRPYRTRRSTAVDRSAKYPNVRFPATRGMATASIVAGGIQQFSSSLLAPTRNTRALGCEWCVWRTTATMTQARAKAGYFSLCRSAHTPRRIGPSDSSAARRDRGQIPRRRLRLLRTETRGCVAGHDRLKFVSGA